MNIFDRLYCWTRGICTKHLEDKKYYCSGCRQEKCEKRKRKELRRENRLKRMQFLNGMKR